jgi:hypothetical protein
MGLCRYSGLLGQPNQGVHTHVLGVAVFDVLLTVVASLGLWWLLKTVVPSWRVSFWLVLLLLFLSSILVHRLFCVRTTVDRMLFP